MRSEIFIKDTAENRLGVFTNPHFTGLSFSTICKNGNYAVANIEHNNDFSLHGYYDTCDEIADDIINDRNESLIEAFRIHYFDNCKHDIIR